MVRRGSERAGILLGGAGEGRGADAPRPEPVPAVAVRSLCQVFWLPRGLPALRNPPRSREATFIYAAEGCLTQGAFSCGGRRPSEHSSGCTSGRALKNPEATLSVFPPPQGPSEGSAAGARRQQQQGGTPGAGKGEKVLGRLLGEQPPKRLRGHTGKARDSLATQVGPSRQDLQDIQPRYSGLGKPPRVLPFSPSHWSGAKGPRCPAGEKAPKSGRKAAGG